MPTLVRLPGSAVTERHVRPRFVVPVLKVLQLITFSHGELGPGDSCAERLHGQDKAFLDKDRQIVEFRRSGTIKAPFLLTMAHERQTCDTISDRVPWPTVAADAN